MNREDFDLKTFELAEKLWIENQALSVEDVTKKAYEFVKKYHKFFQELEYGQ